jgi:hypothetical protein
MKPTTNAPSSVRKPPAVEPVAKVGGPAVTSAETSRVGSKVVRAGLKY